MDNFSASQYDRFEAYRRHALPKTAVRKVSSVISRLDSLLTTHICAQSQVIQQTLGQQVSQPVAQIVAGFAKVFVGEMVEKGRPHFLLSIGRSLTSDVLQHDLSKNREANTDL